eukprot:3246726-Rhodomonas_salina.2
MMTIHIMIPIAGPGLCQLTSLASDRTLTDTSQDEHGPGLGGWEGGGGRRRRVRSRWARGRSRGGAGSGRGW